MISLNCAPMKYEIIDLSRLRKILWADFALGFSSGLLGMVFTEFFSDLFGLTFEVVFYISLVTAGYAVVAFSLVISKRIPILPLRGLIYANWAWTLVSCGIIYFHFLDAVPLGQIWLLLQIIVVGGLAYLEGRQLRKVAA